MLEKRNHNCENLLNCPRIESYNAYKCFTPACDTGLDKALEVGVAAY